MNIMKKALTNLLSLSALVILASCGGQKADASNSSSSFISSEPTSSVSLSSNEATSEESSSEESSSEPAMSSVDSQQSTSESKPVSSSSTPAISSASSSAPSYVNDQLSTSNGLVVKFNRNGLGASIDSISWNNKQIAKDGFVVGRCANRIANGKFSINDKQYSVSINANPHSLHGGTGSGMNSWRGPFATKNWTKVEQTASSITYTIHSPDEENGYPGNMDMTVKYTLSEEGDLAIQYTATSDKDTLCNPTNHLFINISGNNSYDNIVLGASSTSQFFNWEKGYLWNAHIDSKAKHIGDGSCCIASANITYLFEDIKIFLINLIQCEHRYLPL